LRLRRLRHREIEEVPGQSRLRIGTNRDHGEVVRILELAVHREPEQGDEHLVALNDDRHRGRDLRSRIGPDDEVDLVDVEQLGVDARHRRGIALVVVVDELDGTAQQPALGVDVLLPDLLGEQRRLSVGGEAAGHRHAETDLDRLSRLRHSTDCQHSERSDDGGCRHAKTGGL